MAGRPLIPHPLNRSFNAFGKARQEVFVFHHPSFMEDTADNNPLGVRKIEDDVLALLGPVQAGMDIETRTSDPWRPFYLFGALDDFCYITMGLLFAPVISGVIRDFSKV